MKSVLNSNLTKKPHPSKYNMVFMILQNFIRLLLKKTIPIFPVQLMKKWLNKN
jgi:hypothetical protein